MLLKHFLYNETSLNNVIYITVDLTMIGIKILGRLVLNIPLVIFIASAMHLISHIEFY